MLNLYLNITSAILSLLLNFKKKEEIGGNKNEDFNFFWEEKICLLWDILKFSFLTQLTFLV